MSDMLDWLEKNGVLLCNQNPELPALEDLGCTWREAMELVDAHQVFYCKAYKKRTTYLSQEAYYLLKAVKPSRPPPPSAQALLGVLAENPEADTAFLKTASGLLAKEFRAGLDFLLENLLATAVAKGRDLNANWSQLRYGTAKEWERLAGAFPIETDRTRARERLWALVGGVMTERQFGALAR